MSVPKSKRSLSDMEFYRTAIELRIKVSEFLLRDFGAKPKVRTLQNLQEAHKMSDEDAKTLSDLMDKYNLGDRVLETFPEWWIEQRRLKLDEILSDLLIAIRKANSIYPQTMIEYEERRLNQTRAIANAYQSWRGNITKLNTHRSVQSMDKFYNNLFLEN